MAKACRGDPLSAKLEVFQLLAYQLSNKLIEDPDIDSEDQVRNFDKYEHMVQMFRKLDLPPSLWMEIFLKGTNRTTAAFAEMLFEAAIDSMDIEIVTLLLESHIVDPNQPVWTWSAEGMRYPIQWAAGTSGEGEISMELVELLVRLGADVKAWTNDDPCTAIHSIALLGTLEMARFLVQNGADLRNIVLTMHDCVSNITPLGGAAQDWRVGRKERGEAQDEELELESVRVFRYLLSLHDPVLDHLYIQDAFILAAKSQRCDLAQIARDAGANVNE
jgi:hypothetical protein